MHITFGTALWEFLSIVNSLCFLGLNWSYVAIEYGMWSAIFYCVLHYFVRDCCMACTLTVEFRFSNRWFIWKFFIDQLVMTLYFLSSSSLFFVTQWVIVHRNPKWSEILNRNVITFYHFVASALEKGLSTSCPVAFGTSMWCMTFRG
jgi:hypothetical protein